MNDQALYTGVDNEPKGMFDNEVKDAKVEKKIEEQTRLLKELTPKLQDILSMIDNEIKLVDSVSDFKDITSMPDIDIRAELKARAQYKEYLGRLKTQFGLALGEIEKE